MMKLVVQAIWHPQEEIQMESAGLPGPQLAIAHVLWDVDIFVFIQNLNGFLPLKESGLWPNTLSESLLSRMNWASETVGSWKQMLTHDTTLSCLWLWFPSVKLMTAETGLPDCSGGILPFSLQCESLSLFPSLSLTCKSASSSLKSAPDIQTPKDIEWSCCRPWEQRAPHLGNPKPWSQLRYGALGRRDSHLLTNYYWSSQCFQWIDIERETHSHLLWAGLLHHCKLSNRCQWGLAASLTLCLHGDRQVWLGLSATSLSHSWAHTSHCRKMVGSGISRVPWWICLWCIR